MTRKELINNIVMAIYADLKDRRGVLDGIDDDILGQIRSAWRKIVRGELDRHDVAEQLERVERLNRLNAAGRIDGEKP